MATVNMTNSEVPKVIVVMEQLFGLDLDLLHQKVAGIDFSGTIVQASRKVAENDTATVKITISPDK